MRDFLISASILSADLSCLGQEMEAVLAAGADMLHIDVMDNHYVPNLTFGPMLCEALHRRNNAAVLDVHLMVKPVDALIVAFAKAGAQQISFHPEASEHVDRSLQLIRTLGCKAGLALNPATSLACLKHVWHHLDFVLIMSVNPGFSGQPFISEALNKVSTLQSWLTRAAYNKRLAVDGGITLANIASIARAGADTFVIGSAIFAHNDYHTTLAQLRAALAG